ncbi:MAG: citrate lyase acyl carrier protein [Ruminococcaceae bacterium]|nr:citrate lyase acyl carrier protein [Oscillospiraceae bacterium]
MKMINPAIAGTMESGDIMIEIRDSENKGIHIELESTVMNQFGKQIEKVIEETAKACGLENVDIIAKDKGSLDCTIRARVTTAAMRGCGKTEFEWK